jgi:murein DD-endopeptidase MepM/ murein hydrolase activator NlpD
MHRGGSDASASAVRRPHRHSQGVPVAFLGVLLAGSAAAYGTGSRLDAPPPAVPAMHEPRDDADFEKLLLALEARERELERELGELDPAIDTARRRMTARGRAYYRLVRAGFLPVGGGFDQLVDHAVAVERLRQALGRDATLERQLEARKGTAKTELERLRAEKAPLIVQRDAMQKARIAIQQADERRAAFARAFGGTDPFPSATIYGAGSDAATGDSRARFAQLRGRLSLPLAGRAEVLTSDTPGPAGVRILGVGDAVVRTVYAGRVVFVGQTPSGLTVVVDHGDLYFTLYGNLARAEVTVGEQVPERARLGWILKQGAERPMLYFEIRRGQELLDTAPWLGL